ncbi:6,7-dimethyl-8-ribityllumazine synthase [Companilactobacillus versmoldensis]|uniref:6,7-dimethyl-8-ribityllumazine synthase n=1 Tax=Companilactobacillus versmoldensis DSM 14857 = KCTC 3814 TaxID=1423815 RepID=A0A0R1SJ13_9LACO|nr:6,7-dimethyl-8-ribityllumazine synthase [Companilactobacillus versmoldensis]KRL67540.1 6,7-dimethyl-8-ribityllumazine synthase [Companilactobacillus versmoldensis DSM 14857 = KCTC 3814]
MAELRGKINGSGLKIGIVVAQFNELVTKKLLDGAVNELQKYDVQPDDITTLWVPGAVEIPRITKKLSDSGKVDGIIALGAVVRGETAHFDYVCAESANGIADVSLHGDVPVMYGVLTTNDMDQAMNRAGGKSGNKGAECASGILEMISLEKQI